jgi:hypothetical protein
VKIGDFALLCLIPGAISQTSRSSRHAPGIPLLTRLLKMLRTQGHPRHHISVVTKLYVNYATVRASLYRFVVTAYSCGENLIYEMRDVPAISGFKAKDNDAIANPYICNLYNASISG